MTTQQPPRISHSPACIMLVNIGIEGSDPGPLMAYQALASG